MENNQIKYSLQDFSLIKSTLEKTKKDYSIDESSNAFYLFVMNLLFGLQDDEIIDSITDNHFLKVSGSPSGHDRGIDAVYIDDEESKVTIHFFNFKYTDVFEKTKNHFPSSEIDKIITFLNCLMQKDKNLKNDVNPILFSKVEQIWSILENQNPHFVIHICSNLYHGFEKNEKERFEREIYLHSNFNIQYHLMADLVKLLTKKDKMIVNGKIRAIDKNFFEKSDGDIRALIVDVDARDLIRLVLDNEDIREKADITDYERIKQYKILEDAFENNVRVYLKQRSKINRNIKSTALSEDNHRFFYYNNGITLTCDSFEYIKTMRAPVIELKNVQVVNGSQTIHALYDAYLENASKLEYIDILCRIYETKNSELSTKIAEYTNSQNPVKSRDIRSIDFMQQKLEQELLAKGLYYERKKNQYSDKKKELRLDAEKTGQVLMTFFNKMPAEAKDQKKLIFADKYEDVFNDAINADKVLLAYRLFERIEKAKNVLKERLLREPDDFEKESFMLYASYYNHYILAELAQFLKIDQSYNKIEDIWKLYKASVNILTKLVETEKSTVKGYTDAAFFKSNRPKKLFEELLKQKNIKVFLK